MWNTLTPLLKCTIECSKNDGQVELYIFACFLLYVGSINICTVMVDDTLHGEHPLLHSLFQPSLKLSYNTVYAVRLTLGTWGKILCNDLFDHHYFGISLCTFFYYCTVPVCYKNHDLYEVKLSIMSVISCKWTWTMCPLSVCFPIDGNVCFSDSPISSVVSCQFSGLNALYLSYLVYIANNLPAVNMMSNVYIYIFLLVECLVIIFSKFSIVHYHMLIHNFILHECI